MKKEQLIGFGAYILAGAIWGIAEVILEENGWITPISFWGAIASLIVSIFLQIIFHELGHLEAGLMSGYQFSSFRIGSLTWIKEDGKIKFKRYSLNGTAGQCLMVPPVNAGYDYPVVLYNLGGILMNIIVSLIMLIPSFYMQSGELLIFSFVGLFIIITNGIPMKSAGIANDGMNVKCLKKDPLAMQAFDCQLRSNALLMKGVRLKDMPDQWFEISDDSDLSNINTGTMVYMQVGRLLDKCQFAETKEKIQWALSNVTGMLGLHKNELKCELIFCEIMLGEYEEAEKLYEYEMKKYIQATAGWLSRKRLMYAYNLLVEKDYKKAEKELEMFNLIKKKYPYQGDMESEDQLVELVYEVYMSIT
ncbi:MAG: hypothetical protein ACLRZ9_01585 [Eubacterium sp.]